MCGTVDWVDQHRWRQDKRTWDVASEPPAWAPERRAHPGLRMGVGTPRGWQSLTGVWPVLRLAVPCAVFSSVAPPPGSHPLPSLQGFPATQPCSPTDRMELPHCELSGRGQGGRARVRGWLAARAACLAASLTGCQLAPRAQGLFLCRVCSWGKGSEVGGGHATRLEGGGQQAQRAAWVVGLAHVSFQWPRMGRRQVPRQASLPPLPQPRAFVEGREARMGQASRNPGWGSSRNPPTPGRVSSLPICRAAPGAVQGFLLPWGSSRGAAEAAWS